MKTIAIALLGVAALLAVLGSLWCRRWMDALLVALASAALGGMAFRFSLPGELAGAVDAGSADAAAVAGARSVRADGDGLSAARWQDLPARPLDWQEREVEDKLFGSVVTKTKRAKADELEHDFLRQGWSQDSLDNGVIYSSGHSNTPKSGKTWVADIVSREIRDV